MGAASSQGVSCSQDSPSSLLGRDPFGVGCLPVAGKAAERDAAGTKSAERGLNGSPRPGPLVSLGMLWSTT